MGKQNRLYAIVIALVAIIVVASVGAVLYYQGQSNPQSQTPIVTLTDDTGYETKLAAYPNRIVSLAPANTQILFAVGAGNQVVGVTDYCNYPYDFSAWVAAGNMSSIGDYFNPTIEPVIALNPDLIVAALGSEDLATQLRSQGYKVLYFNPSNLTGILNNMIKVGKATNHEAEAQAQVNLLQQRIDVIVNGVKNATTRPKVYDEVWSDPYTSVGKDTFIDGLIKLAGGRNIFENETTPYPTYSSEAVITLNPDIIVFPSSMGMSNFWGNFTAVAQRPGWSSITAIKNNALYTIDGDMINQPAPRQVDALEALAKIIHPEIFGNYTNQP